MKENHLQKGNVGSQAGDCAHGMREGLDASPCLSDGVLWWRWGDVNR